MLHTVVDSARGARERGAHAAWRTAETYSDLVRLGLAVILLLLSVLAIQRDALSTFERDVFRVVNDLPHWLVVPVWPIEQLGTRFAPIVLGALVIAVLRRLRLGLSIMVAGTGAWLLAQGLKQLVERARPADFLGDLPREWSSGGPGFVSGHTAVATAVVAVTAPYLPRPWRRVVWALVGVVGFARVYTGVHLPLDVVGGFAVGWFVGTLVHLLVGTTRPRRTPELVADMLARLGVDVATVEAADVYAEVSHPFRATTKQGERLFVKVLDPDPRSSDWVQRVARVFATREQRDISALASLPVAADHEAALTLAARSAGVRVPAVVLARGDGAAAVVVLEEVDGHDLSATHPETLGDEVLRGLWEQVGRLRRARIAHRDLVRANVLLDRDGRPWLIDFRDAEVGASDDALDGDVAELLASLAVAVGPERAVDAAVAELGQDAVTRAVPGLESFALSPRTRRELNARPGLLDALRTAAGGVAEATSGLVNIHLLWVPALVAAGGYAVLLTVAGWGTVVDAGADARLRWVGVCAAVLAAVPLLLGYATRLSVHRRVAVGRSAAAAAVAGSAEIVGGAAARRHHLERYMRSCGARADEPARAVDLLITAERAAALLILLVAASLGWQRADLQLDLTGPTAAFLVVALVAGAGGWAVQRLRRSRSPAVSVRQDTAQAVRAARTAPGRSLAVLCAVAGAELALVLALAAALRAVEPAVSLAVVAVALAGTRIVMALLGISGLPVVGEAACTAALCALGVPPAQAVLAVLVYAVLRYWVTGAVSAVVAPRLAPVHVREPAVPAPA